jgi:TonB-linked SusC/RagA family outer membrane protein
MKSKNLIMRKLLYTLVVLFSMSLAANAQVKVNTLSGKITDESGLAVPFATIKIVGSKAAFLTDADGNYSLKNLGNAKQITVSCLGFKTVTLDLNSKSLNNIVLTSVAENLKEVVVTNAFGLKQSSKTTPYSVQVISGEKLNTVVQPNLNAALGGKVAGLQLRDESNVALGRNSNVRLRGEGTIGGSSPLYVVDGTPMNSSDINTQDIESVTVLKGANATALFGDRASSGAFVITTKKGGSKKGVGIDFTQSLTADVVYRLPKYQNLYAGGDGTWEKFNWEAGMPTAWQALNGKYYHDYADDGTWGPKMTGQEYIPWYAWYPNTKYSYKTAALTPQPNNVRDFWNTGTSSTTNLSFYKTGDNSSTRVSYSNQNINGLLPNSKQDKHTLFITNKSTFKKFTLETNLSYVTNKVIGEFSDGYANASTGSFSSWFHRDIDMNILRELKDVQTPEGYYGSWNHNNPGEYLAGPSGPQNFLAGNYWYNPFKYFDWKRPVTLSNRLIGNVSLSYKLNNHLKFTANIRRNQISSSYEDITPTDMQNSATQNGAKASYNVNSSISSENNYEFITTYNNKFGQFALNSTAGYSLRSNSGSSMYTYTNNGLVIPNLYTLANSKDPVSYGSSRNRSEFRSIFATTNFAFKEFISVDVTARNDFASVLQKGTNIFYPSVGSSFILSELVRMPTFINNLKFFGSWGQKPMLLSAYAFAPSYGLNANQWSGNPLMGTPNSIIDPNLTGSLISTKEAGMDLKLFNKITANFTYFEEINDKQPVSVSISGASGFTSSNINAARIDKKGYEIQINANIISNKIWTYDLSVNYANLLYNKVVAIAPGISRISLGSDAFGQATAYAELGETWGQLIGPGTAKDKDGNAIINSNGTFKIAQNQHFGSVLPKHTGGMINTLRFKGNLELNANITYQFGGKFYSLTEMFGSLSGLLESTAVLNDKGKNVRDDVADGGGAYVQGVNAAGLPVYRYVDGFTYFHQFYGNASPFIHSFSYIKLQELSLGYHLPVNKIGLKNICNDLTVSLIARKPLLIWSEDKMFDPSEISPTFGENGQFPSVRGVGLNIKVTF